MTFLFKCANCKNLIRGDYSQIGDLVECPFCGFIQTTPEAILDGGTMVGDFQILSSIHQGPLWSEYIAKKLDTGNPKQTFLLRIPSDFFLKRVSNYERFAEHVIRAGTTGIDGLEKLSDRCIKKGEEYFAYPYNADYKSLASLYASMTRFSEMDALLLLKNIVVSLHKVWEKDGLIHTNLGPANVFIKIAKLEPLLSGIGISQFLVAEKELLDSGFNIWNQHYVAPEFFKNGKIDSSTVDIYSLGCILYTLLSGEFAPPQFNENAEQLNQTEKMLARLSDVKLNISENTICLFSSLRSDDLKRRISSYNEILIRIEEAIQGTKPKDQDVKYRKNINIWGKFRLGEDERKTPSPKRGIGIGFIQKKKLYVTARQKTVMIKNSAGKVVSLKSVRNINYYWRSKKKNLNYGLIVAGIILLVATIFVYQYKTRFHPARVREDKKASRQDYVDKSTKNLKFAEEKTQSLANKEAKNLDNQTKDGQLSPANAKLHEKLADISRFATQNPQNYDEIIEKYETLKRPYVLSQKLEEVNIINELIFQTEKEKQKKIDETLQDIIGHMNNLIKNGQKSDAILYLDSYDKIFAEETKRQRKEIARKILEGESVVEIQKGVAIKILDSIIENNANNLLSGRIKEVSIKLKMELNNPTIKPIIDILKAFIADLDEFSMLKATIIEKKKSAKTISDEFDKISPESQNLLKGLFHAEIGEFEKAYNDFDKMPFGIGNTLINALYEIDAEKTAQKILEKYSIELKTGYPDVLVTSLYKKQWSPKNARAFLDEIKNFELNYPDSLFMEKNASQIETIKKYCFRFLETQEKEKEREFIILGDLNETASSSGAQLLALLEKADNWTTIRLKKGIYSFSSREDRERMDKNNVDNLEQDVLSRHSFSLSLTGLKLIGEEGVIFENDITITAQSVEISNIEIRKGAFLILPHSHNVLPDSGNIIVRNCVFSDRETRIKNGIDITFENCFSRGMIIEKSKNIDLRHCTIVSQHRGLSQNAAIWIDGDGMDIFESIVYGDYLAVIFSDKGKNVKKESDIKIDDGINIVDTLLYGDRGICAFQFEDSPLDEKKFILSGSKLSRYCKPKRNIYYPPEFTDSSKGNWQLVKGTPGYKGGIPRYKGGTVYPKNKNAKDVGVLWDEINIDTEQKVRNPQGKR
jgi:serine/threonine protein kinase